MDIRTIALKPLGNYTFHLEFQLCNSAFHVQEEPTIKQNLNLSNNEWQHIVTILSALPNGYRYDSSAIAARTSDLPSRVMHCFVQSIPLFVRSNIQFKNFMVHCLEMSEQQPLRNDVDAAVDPRILGKMKELKRQLDKGG
ncbi:hypothetical protein HA402_010790 [Bradysia odoriphaga]|nr:hypothetical protein HA402_010790 [Bradysia odoriphaga]